MTLFWEILVTILPILVVVFLFLAFLDREVPREDRRGVVVILLLMIGGTFAAIALRPFENLHSWQMGLFGVLFALALVGLSYLREKH